MFSVDKRTPTTLRPGDAIFWDKSAQAVIFVRFYEDRCADQLCISDTDNKMTAPYLHGEEDFFYLANLIGLLFHLDLEKVENAPFLGWRFCNPIE